MTIEPTPDEIAAVIHTAIHEGTQFAAGVLHLYEWMIGMRADAPFDPAENIARCLPESLEPVYVVTELYEPVEVAYG